MGGTAKLVSAGRTRFVSALKRAGDMVMPPLCLACENHVMEQGILCASCWGDVRFIEKPYCEILGIPFTYDLGPGALSAEAIANPPPFNRLRSVVYYDRVPRRLVQGLKFADRTELAPWMARWMIRASDDLLKNGGLIVPVPLHKWRLFRRRFNQSAELARAIAKLSGQPYAPEILTRVRRTRQQVGLGQKQRADNVRGAFRVPADEKINLKGRRVILVDDVFTTGATLEACTRSLLRAGAQSVDCLTFARVARGLAVTDL